MRRAHFYSAETRLTTLAILIFALFSGFAPPAPAAANDNNVEWDGVYSDRSFRSPESPTAGQSFNVELRVFRGDITGARVRTFDGAVQHHDMVWFRNTGSANQYDIWRAAVSTSPSALFLHYRFEISDGSDTDHYNRLGMSGGEPASGDFLINLTELGGYPLGATPTPTGAVFRVWAPNASTAHVAGEFNAWNATISAMTNIAGVWQTRLGGAAHGHEYKYVFDHDGTHWRTDPHARRHTSSVGNSVIWDTQAYAWNDGDWVTPFFEDMIVYELHVGTFSGQDDGVDGHPATFRDVIDAHLDHLVELGVNVVQLMPVNEFAADLSWGYNPVSQFAIESIYGRPDDLKYLVDRCHQAGLAVLVDVVFNHMGASDLAGNLLEFDGEEIYFYPIGHGFRETPWGPRPDYGIRAVRDYLGESIRHWLREYRVDGFRLDGTDYIKVNTDGWRLLRDIKEITDTASVKAVVIAEQLPNDPAVTRSIDTGGAGLDSQWNDAFHDALREALGEAAFGDPDMGRLAAGMNHFDFGGVKAVNYIESHDEVAVHGRAVRAADGSNPHSEWAYGRGKLAYGLVMFTAGIPMILQGQEWMEDRTFGDATEHRIQWSYKEQFADYFLACRDMTWLRRRSPALRAGAGQNVFHVNDGANVVAWHRWNELNDDLVIVAGFNNADLENYCLGMPLSGDWLELLNTDAAAYGGRNQGNGGSVSANDAGMHGQPFSACLTIPRMGVLVLGRRAVDLTPDLDADKDGLPNDWERANGLDPNQALDAAQDSDGDGMTNLEEFQAGTDPRSALSLWRIERLESNGAGAWELTWQSVAGRRYAIYASPVLETDGWTAIDGQDGTGEMMRFVDERSVDGSSQFYRIQVEPARP